MTAAAALRTSQVEAIISRPPEDVAPMRRAFSQMVAQQWQAFVPKVVSVHEGGTPADAAKARFIGEMYARACYSMFLVSGQGPRSLRFPVRASWLLPQSRQATIWLGSAVLARLDHLLPRAVHRQLMLTSALMGVMDVVLDRAAGAGESAVLRVASLITADPPAGLGPAEQGMVALVEAIRETETAWQARYWEQTLEPAVRDYCLAEARAVEHAPDPSGMGHRGAGIEAVIKGMWYVAGPHIGLEGRPTQFERGQWNREQQWMADTTLLMQMIDDWVDQDQDRDERLTPVGTGEWTLQAAGELFQKTMRDLDALLDASGIQQPVLKSIFADLYRDYLHTAMDAMRSGIAA